MLSSMVPTRCHAGDEGFEPVERVGEERAGEFVARAFEVVGVDADGDQRGRELPGVFDVGGLHPLGEGLFGVALFERVHAQRLFLGERVLLQVEHALLLLVAEVGLGELGGELVHAHQVFAQLRRGADGGGAGVVQLVHQAGGEGAERGHLLLLHHDALELLEPVRHVAEDGLAHLGAGGHDVPELLFVELEQVAGFGGADAGGVGGVGEQRKLAHGGAGGDVGMICSPPSGRV